MFLVDRLNIFCLWIKYTKNVADQYRTKVKRGLRLEKECDNEYKMTRGSTKMCGQNGWDTWVGKWRSIVFERTITAADLLFHIFYLFTGMKKGPCDL